MNTNGTSDGMAAIGVRVKDAAAQAIPAGKRAGTTAVQGVRQGVQDATDWAAPRLEDAVVTAREWMAPRLEVAVLGARGWAAPRLEDAADTVDEVVAPTVSSALRSAARQVRPPSPAKRGVGRMLDWRVLLGVGAAAAAAGAAAAVTVRRRYAAATAAANDAGDSPAAAGTTQAGEPADDPGVRSEVNGQVTTPGT